jgi:hypothetical protein
LTFVSVGVPEAPDPLPALDVELVPVRLDRLGSFGTWTLGRCSGGGLEAVPRE